MFFRKKKSQTDLAGMPAAPCPPPKPYEPQYSELEKMVIATKRGEVEAAITKAIDDLSSALDMWTPEDRKSRVHNRLISDIRRATYDFMFTNNQQPGSDRAPIAIEYMLSDFGSKVLASLKKKAGRK